MTLKWPKRIDRPLFCASCKRDGIHTTLSEVTYGRVEDRIHATVSICPVHAKMSVWGLTEAESVDLEGLGEDLKALDADETPRCKCGAPLSTLAQTIGWCGGCENRP